MTAFSPVMLGKLFFVVVVVSVVVVFCCCCGFTYESSLSLRKIIYKKYITDKIKEKQQVGNIILNN